MDPKIKVARLSIISNTLLTAGKLAVGLLMGSVSVLSEAIHSGLDLLAAIIAFLSVRQSGKPADELHRYGHGKFENLAAIIEALLIVGAAVGILWHAVPKLFHGQGEIEALGLGMAVMGISGAVNWFVSNKLMKVAKETGSPALEADAWHLRTDVYTSLGVLAGIALIKLTGKTIIDPLIGIGVTLLILKAAYDLLHDSMSSILDAKLPQEEEETIHKVLTRYQNRFVNYHKLRTRKAGPQRHVDLHIVVPRCNTILEAHRLCDDVENDLKEALPRSNVLIHSEPCEPPEHCENCRAGCDCKSSGPKEK
ncbi:cation diffusion facilitator family transporter [Desulfohalotomaculum tongense]|uniref:cation diffusion facilitator family transporter n=1 Tax=Desulforadius tongensis TaxID=1216062 RepID=UPI00195A0BA3|nr:cation diffusion facilitator family transporter [Desulforadius tongensis]